MLKYRTYVSFMRQNVQKSVISKMCRHFSNTSFSFFTGKKKNYRYLYLTKEILLRFLRLGEQEEEEALEDVEVEEEEAFDSDLHPTPLYLKEELFRLNSEQSQYSRYKYKEPSLILRFFSKGWKTVIFSIYICTRIEYSGNFTRD